MTTFLGDLEKQKFTTNTAGQVAIRVIDDTSGTMSTIAQGTKNVTTAGTAEALATTTASKFVIIQAKITNTGIIYVGGTGVTSANGIALYAGDLYTIGIDNLSDIFINSSVSGEGVNYNYTN